MQKKKTKVNETKKDCKELSCSSPVRAVSLSASTVNFDVFLLFSGKSTGMFSWLIHSLVIVYCADDHGVDLTISNIDSQLGNRIISETLRALISQHTVVSTIIHTYMCTSFALRCCNMEL